MRPYARTESVELFAFGENAIVCPICGEANLCHGRISVYQRKEDQRHVLRTIVDATITTSTVIGDTDNPNLRRHGLAIEFRCEQCGDIGELTIAQHKGRTLINWR